MQKSRLRISKPLPYFEFLNLASKMDYLLLNDASFEIPQLNPFLPSKLADYLSVKTRIIALIQEHSPLSKIENCYLIKRKFINSDFIASLTPKST